MKITQPMLGRAATEQEALRLIEDETWALDVKADGHRRLIVADDGILHTYGRDGQRTGLPQRVADIVGALRGQWVFDGELIGDTLVLFDLVHAGELITPATPWHERRHVLSRIHDAWAPGPPVRLIPYAETADQKIDLYERVIAGRGEGLMAKRVTAPYVPCPGDKRSGHWLKVKRQHTADCVVLSLGTKRENMVIGLYKPGATEPTEIGEIGRGTGDGPRVQKGQVIEVRFLYATDDDHLYQATLPRIRTDKAPEECTWDQLDAARTNKALLLEMTK